MKYLVSLAAWTTGIVGLLVLGPGIYAALVYGGRRTNSLGCRLLGLLVNCFGVRVKREGRERIDASRSYLFMANHCSFFDFFILGAWLPGYTRGLEAAEHFSWPLWGSFLRGSGMVPIDRSNPRASVASLHRAAERLQSGTSMLVLPEGTRSRDGRMLPLKRLPFRLARDAGVDLVPVGLNGTFRVKPKTTWLIRPGTVRMRFGEPIPAAEIREMSVEELMEETRRRIETLAFGG